MASGKLIDSKTLSVGILGYTGASGKALLNEILKTNMFKNTTLIGRRIVEYKEDMYKNASQKLVDFDKLNEHDEAFKDLDIVFCCLGTTRGKSGAEGFRKVDYDYIVESAKMAKKNGCKYFQLVSSAGADKNSFMLYPKTKGEAEEAITNLNFDRLSIYRPKMLVSTKREETRVMESVAIALTKPFQYLAPTLITTPIDILAKSMLANILYVEPKDTDKKTEIVDNCHIFELAKLYDKQQQSQQQN